MLELCTSGVQLAPSPYLQLRSRNGISIWKWRRRSPRVLGSLPRYLLPFLGSPVEALPTDETMGHSTSLEVNLDGPLPGAGKHATGARGVENARELAEGRAGDGSRWIVEVRRIERIEELQAHLDFEPLVDARVFDK